ncbi:redoxin domain-containing protein, partial [bacterium]|nr:redoxin domain-containing protein [bacterium]
MPALHLDQDAFQKEVLDHKGYVLVDFYAEWCGPCKMTSPIIDQLTEEIKDVKFVKIDVDKSPDLASQFSIFSIPT